MDIIAVRNRINHCILNNIMHLRYQVRKRPTLVRCLIVFEGACIRVGLIFYGHSHLHGKAHHV